MGMLTNRLITSADEARSPETVEWALRLLEKGHTLKDVREAAGLDLQDWRWRVLRKEITEFRKPKTESEALTEFYLEQSERIRVLEEQLKDIDKRISEGASHKPVCRPDGEPYVNKMGDVLTVEDKSYPQLFKARNEIMKLLCDESDRQFKNFMETKKVQRGFGKYAGAKINIFTNVPRPQLEAIVDAEEIEEKNDTSE